MFKECLPKNRALFILNPVLNNLFFKLFNFWVVLYTILYDKRTELSVTMDTQTK